MFTVQAPLFREARPIIKDAFRINQTLKASENCLVLLDDTCNSDQLSEYPRGSVVGHELNTGVHAEDGVQEAADETDGDCQENTQNTGFVESKHNDQAAECADQGFVADCAEHQFCPGTRFVHCDRISDDRAADKADETEDDVVGQCHELRQVVADLKSGSRREQRSRRAGSHAADRYAAKSEQGDDQAGNISCVGCRVFYRKSCRNSLIKFFAASGSCLTGKDSHADRAHCKSHAGDRGPKAAECDLLLGQLLEGIRDQRQTLLALRSEPCLVFLILAELFSS